MTKISDVSMLITKGTTPTTVGGSFCTSGVNFIKVESIDNNGCIIPKYIQKISQETNQKLKRSQLKENDLLITIAGALGRTYVVDQGILPANTNQAVGIIRLDPNKYSSHFVKYWIQTSWVQKTLGLANAQSIQNNLNLVNLGDIEIPEFSLDKQMSIVGILSSIEKKIACNKKINEELSVVLNTLYKYWFVQFDFPNKNGEPYRSSGGEMVWNKDIKRDVPKGWQLNKIGDLLNKNTDKSIHIESKNILENGQYPVITQDNGDFIAGFTDENNPIKDTPVIIFGDHSCTLRYVDFPFFRGADGTQIMRFDKDLTTYIYLFLENVINNIPNYGKYERHFKYLKEFEVIIPEQEYLKKFQSLAKPLFDKISRSRQENQILSSLRDSLLPMLMNGQVSVK